jgi:hypothetical protein
MRIKTFFLKKRGNKFRKNEINLDKPSSGQPNNLKVVDSRWGRGRGAICIARMRN